jgi:hypothetical protein
VGKKEALPVAPQRPSRHIVKKTLTKKQRVQVGVGAGSFEVPALFLSLQKAKHKHG